MPHPPQLCGLKLLLVEDSPDNRKLFCCILKRDGAEVDLATNGAEAVKTALENEHDVVLMDLMMPEMDGYEATQELRRKGYKKHIIAFTASAFLECKERCMNSGFNEYITKPVNPGKLISFLQPYAHVKKSS